MEYIERNKALELLQQYNKDPFHLHHALTVEAVMKWYANELGLAMMQNIGALSDCCMILISNYIRRSIA